MTENFKVVKSKKIGDRFLTLDEVQEDHSYPNAQGGLFLLHISQNEGNWVESGSGTLFITAPEAYLLSRAAYDVLFDKITSPDDFNKLQNKLETEVNGLYESFRSTNP